LLWSPEGRPAGEQGHEKKKKKEVSRRAKPIGSRLTYSDDDPTRKFIYFPCSWLTVNILYLPGMVATDEYKTNKNLKHLQQNLKTE
jgi:hypothetical protein